MKQHKSLLLKAARPVFAAAAVFLTSLNGSAAGDLKFDKDFPAELLLSSGVFQMYKIKGVMDSFEKLPGEGFLIGTGGQIVATDEWGSLLKQPFPGLRSFRLFPDGEILAVTQRGQKAATRAYLAYYQAGRLSEQVLIPDPDMKIAISADSSEFYLYGGKKTANVVYRYTPKEKPEVAVEVSGAVGALAGDRKTGLYLAIGDVIYEISPDSKVRFMARVRGKKILSLAYDGTGEGCLFASVKDTVLLLKPEYVRTVMTGVGGTLRLRNGKLFVFDNRKKMIIQADYSKFRGAAAAPAGRAGDKRKKDPDAAPERE